MKNYDREMTDLISGLSGRPRLLLHACCAPCATAVVERLLPAFDLTLLFYNPNIAPRKEYDLRLAELRRLAAYHGLPLIEGPYDEKAFDAAAAGMEEAPEGGARCEACFRLRLDAAAREAAARGFDFFCTTLTVSPHKDAEAVNRAGLAAAEKCGAAFLPSDFKKRDGYKRSVALCRDLAVYRQNYCGCAFSIPKDFGGQPDRREAK